MWKYIMPQNHFNCLPLRPVKKKQPLIKVIGAVNYINLEYSLQAALLMKEEPDSKIQEGVIGCFAGFEGVIVPGKHIQA